MTDHSCDAHYQCRTSHVIPAPVQLVSNRHCKRQNCIRADWGPQRDARSHDQGSIKATARGINSLFKIGRCWRGIHHAEVTGRHPNQRASAWHTQRLVWSLVEASSWWVMSNTCAFSCLSVIAINRDRYLAVLCSPTRSCGNFFGRTPSEW